MWIYDKKLQFPVKIKNPDPKAAKIIILGDEAEITNFYKEKNWSMEDITVLKPENSPKLKDYTQLLYNLRKDKGMTEEDAAKTALNYNYFGTLMVKAGDADGMVSGANHSTADTVRPALQIIKTKEDKTICVGAMLMLKENAKPLVLSDISLNLNPDSKQLAEIAIASAEFMKEVVKVEPKVEPVVEIKQDAPVQETPVQTANITTNASYSKDVLELCDLIKNTPSDKMIPVLQNMNIAIVKQHGFSLNQDDDADVLCEKLTHFKDVAVFTKAINKMLSL